MKTMRLGVAARRFGIGAFMIASLTALLLYSDRGHRPARAPSSTPTKIYRIGIAYFAPEEGNDLCIQGLLAGLRSEGFVETEWRDTPAGAPRRYYRLSRSGQKAVADFRDEWFRFRNSVDEIFRDGGGQR